MKYLTLEEFLELLSSASGDQGIDLISSFQSGALDIEGYTVEDFEDNG
jgi:hypothetical protein